MEPSLAPFWALRLEPICSLYVIRWVWKQLMRYRSGRPIVWLQFSPFTVLSWAFLTAGTGIYLLGRQTGQRLACLPRVRR
jgi:hypothetical protein